jgi:hypothetical protein
MKDIFALRLYTRVARLGGSSGARLASANCRNRLLPARVWPVRGWTLTASDLNNEHDLLTLAIASHGGQARWDAIRTVTAELSIGGALWGVQ